MDTKTSRVVVDTSTLVTGERQKQDLAFLVRRIRSVFGDTPVCVSAVTVMELKHGFERAIHPAQKARRQAFLNDVVSELVVFPVTTEIALLAGMMSGQHAARGVNIGRADLLIGATALHHSCELITENVRHFQLIPNLAVKTL